MNNPVVTRFLGPLAVFLGIPLLSAEALRAAEAAPPEGGVVSPGPAPSGSKTGTVPGGKTEGSGEEKGQEAGKAQPESKPEGDDAKGPEPGPQKAKEARSGGAGPADAPAYYKEKAQEIEGPSVVEGQKAGIEVSQFAPDFQLEPIEPYACLQPWLGADGPEGGEKLVTLSDLVGEQPILLLFGSYT